MSPAPTGVRSPRAPWTWSHNVSCLSRAFPPCLASFTAVINACFAGSPSATNTVPLQTPCSQALDVDLDCGFRGPCLCDRACLCGFRLFLSQREHQVEVFVTFFDLLLRSSIVSSMTCSTMVMFSAGTCSCKPSSSDQLVEWTTGKTLHPRNGFRVQHRKSLAHPPILQPSAGQEHHEPGRRFVARPGSFPCAHRSFHAPRGPLAVQCTRRPRGQGH